MNEKFIVLVSLVAITTGLSYGAVATVQELRDQERQVYGMLGDYWIDTKGIVHVGAKDLAQAQFSLDESFLSRRTMDQINSAIKTAIASFDATKQKAFREAIKEDLGKLENIRTELQKLRDQLDSDAEKLGQLIGKSKDDVLKLADQNLATLISTKITDGAKKIEANLALTTIKKLRPAFEIQTSAPTATKGWAATIEAPEGAGAGSATKPSKVAVAAEAVIESKTKLSSVIKAVSEAAVYAPCQDIHFDIIEDEEGIKFLRLIK